MCIKAEKSTNYKDPYYLILKIPCYFLIVVCGI